ncbi:hypothetical protein HK104_008063, partial [Borealophlyctis nickersoniae]
MSTLTAIRTLLGFPPPEPWAGKNVVFCGASQGIGKATCLVLAREGANLFLVSRNEQALNELANACILAGARTVHIHPANLSTLSASADLYKAAATHFSSRIDAVFLNHLAVPTPTFACLHTDEELTVAADVNLVCMMGLVRDAMPYLHASGGVLTYSSSANVMAPIPTLAVYRAMKAGMTAYLESVREELTLLHSPMHITVAVIGSVATENYLKGVGKQARDADVDFRLAEWVTSNPSTPEAAGEFLADAAARRKVVAYGPSKMEVGSGRFAAAFLPGLLAW